MNKTRGLRWWPTRETIVLRCNKVNPGSTEIFEFQVRNSELFGTSVQTSQLLCLFLVLLPQALPLQGKGGELWVQRLWSPTPRGWGGIRGTTRSSWQASLWRLKRWWSGQQILALTWLRGQEPSIGGMQWAKSFLYLMRSDFSWKKYSFTRSQGPYPLPISFSKF